MGKEMTVEEKRAYIDKAPKEEIIAGILRDIQGRTYARNFMPWWENIGWNLSLGIKGVREFDLPADRKKETIFLVSCGPSMYQYRNDLPKLRELGTVFMQPTAYPWMHRIGLEPDVIVSVDHMEDQPMLIKGATCPVIAPTITDQRLIKEHDVYSFALYHGNSMFGDPVWGPENMRSVLLHRCIDSHGWSSAGDVGNMMAKIAFDMMTGDPGLCNIGAKRLVLVGYDRCFWNGLDRVPYVGMEPEKYAPREDGITWRGQQSVVQMVLYAERLYLWWAMTGANMYRLDHGHMWEIPSLSMGQILGGHYPPPLRKGTIRRRVKKFREGEFLRDFPWTIGTQEEMKEIIDKSAQAGRDHYKEIRTDRFDNIEDYVANKKAQEAGNEEGNTE